MTKLHESFFALIRNEIDKKPLPGGMEYDIDKLLGAAKQHEVAIMVVDALLRNGIVSESDALYKKVKKEFSFAVSKETQSDFFYKKVCDGFAGNKIRYVPLKGAIIRNLYPEPWMRTSCDVDILVRESDLKKATKVLLDLGFETDGKRDFHDISFYCGTEVHFELHFSVCETLDDADVLLKKVWDYTERVSEYEYRETAEFYVFHHIAHMVYHFLEGGCGIRPFIDLWILKQKQFYDEEKLLKLLIQSNLIKFYQYACKLMRVWMDGEEHDETTSLMGKYILAGGAFGSSGNACLVELASKKGKKRYLLKKAFPSATLMCEIYPSLAKRKWLLPLYYAYRFFSKIFGKDRKRTKQVRSSTMSHSKGQYSELTVLLNELEIKK